MGIRKDKAGNLWIGTNDGLVKFSMAAKTYRKYTIEDGLSSNEFGNDAICNNNSNFYFGTLMALFHSILLILFQTILCRRL